MAAIIYTATFASVAIYWFPDSLDNLSYFLGIAMMGVFAVTFTSNEIIRYTRSQVLKWFFRKYQDESDERTREFSRVEKTLALIKVAVPFSASVGYAFYALT